MVVTTTDLELLISKMMIQENKKKYSIDISGNTIKGDGYLGEVTFLKVLPANEQCYNLVVKTAKISQELRKQTPLREAYEREIFMYTKVFPIFREYQKENAVEKEFNKFPRCFYVCSEEFSETVILDNIKFLGYELHDRQMVMNLNHAHLVFKNYAQFHGLSLVLRHQRPALFKTLTKNMTDVFGMFFTKSDLISGIVSDFKKLMKLLMEDNREDIVRKYEGFENQFKEILTNNIDQNHRTSVILHGDCWNNNMMFKYEGNDKCKPKDMCFLDFQLSRVASPILDLSYYLYACTDKSVLKHIDFLLQAYYSSLTDFVKQFSVDVENIISLVDLKEQWKKYGKYGLVLSLFIIKIELCDSSEAPDLADSAENGKLEDMFDINFKNQSIYESRIKDIYIHFAEKFM